MIALKQNEIYYYSYGGITIMALNTLPKGGIADDAVDNTKLDLTSNYAFTGTITGTPLTW